MWRNAQATATAHLFSHVHTYVSLAGKLNDVYSCIFVKTLCLFPPTDLEGKHMTMAATHYPVLHSRVLPYAMLS